MKLKQLGANKTELTLSDGTRVLYSYETPVAYSILTAEGRSFYYTEQKWSATTTRHIKSWLPFEDAMSVPQSEIDEFVMANTGVK